MRTRVFLLFLVVALAACERSSQRGGAAGDAGETGHDHAAHAAEPVPMAGDAADWCAGHGVPESSCTLCNPELIAGFKDAGDWCAEHRLPESVCPICHPGRIQPPPGMAAPASSPGGGPPEDGSRVHMQVPGAAEAAGFETARAAPAAGPESILATAVLVADPARTAIINVRAAGVVREIKADVGTRVKRGAALAVIESAEVAADVSRLAAARSRAAVAEAAYRRETAMHEKGVSSRRAVELAEEESAAARAEVEALTAALALADAGTGIQGQHSLLAPISGVVTRRDAVLGKLVDPEETLFEIIDTSVLWLEIDVPESDAAHVVPGQRVMIEAPGAGRPEAGAGFETVLSYVAPVIDPATRTARARARIANPNGQLRANSYVRARIFIESDAESVLVPRDALQEVKGAHLVFVRHAADEYEVRHVRAGRSGSDPSWIAVVGVHPAEEVVTVGSFLLKTEILKAEIGAGCCEIGPPIRRES